MVAVVNGLVARHLQPLGEEFLGAFPAVVIQGARQVGKSTFAQMLVETRPHTRLSLDDDDVRDAALADPRAFAAQAGAGTLVVDEIQRAPSLLLAIKSSIDNDRRPGRFLLTGSSHLLRLSRTPDSLAGRAATLDLHGLSQGELAGRREDFAAWLRAGDGLAGVPPITWTRADYINAVARGGYPEVRSYSDRLRSAWLDSYTDRLLTRDVGDVSRGLSSDRLAAVLRLVAANQGGELVQARLADTLSIGKSSIAAYLAALSTLYLTHDLPPWRANLTKREVGRHKVSIADSGLALRLAKLHPAALAEFAAAPAFGGPLEAFVVGELIKQRGWSDVEFDLYHVRDRDGLEVALVIEYADGKVFLIEVKASSTYRGEHARGIRALAERLGDRFLGGAVLGLSQESRLLGAGIWGLPVAALWHTAGSYELPVPERTDAARWVDFG